MSDATAEGGVPTLEIVAALAGVSRSTASRVINGSPRVTPETVAAVTSAVERLGYVPNRAARSLVRRKTQMIAMVIPERTTEFFADPYFAEVIQGAAMHASSTDNTLTLLIESDADPDKTRRFLTGGNVDGALILSHHSSTARYVELSRSLPVVFGVRAIVPTDEKVHIVDIDNVEGARLATSRLVEAGRTRIATISGPLDTAAGMDRLEGWRRTVEAAGLTPGAVETGNFTPASGAAAMERLLERDATIDAVFAASAQMGAGALGVLEARGIAVPAAVAMTSMDNNYFATSVTPSLTTVDLHTADKGAIMVDTLLRLIAGDDVDLISRVPMHVVDGGSV
jgi:DNA-binding LacI/PurR family transcriptional regulator